VNPRRTAAPKQSLIRSLVTLLVRNMAIRHKLVAVMMLTSMVALILAGCVFVGYQYVDTRRTMVKTLQTQAEMIADNCKAAVQFEVAKDAEDVLRAFRAQPSVMYACIHTKQGSHFAKYSRPGTDFREPQGEVQGRDGYRFANGLLMVSKPILLEGEKVGTVAVWSDLEPVQAMFRRNLLTVCSVMLLAFLAAYLVSHRVQGVISAPILGLAEVAKTVSEQREYSTRAVKQGNDEVGFLIDSFNEMLGQIQQRDVAMVGANEQLEARVRERTAELSQTNEQLKDEIVQRRNAEQTLRERTERIIRHQAVLLKLNTMTELDLATAFTTTTEALAQTLEVARVGVWLLGDAGDSLVCQDIYELAGQRHEKGVQIELKDYPRYIQALEASRIVAAADAVRDPRTSDLTKGCLKAAGVTSMMGVPIRLHGKLVGVVCHEHTGPVRQWTLEEQDFVASAADMIVIKLETAERRKAEKALELLNQELEATVQELQRSNRELQDFAYVTAHDLKAPLRAIGTLSDWLYGDYREKLDEQAQGHLQLIKGRVSRMNELIDSILRYSEIGRGSRNLQRVNLNALVEETLTLLDPPENFQIIIEDELPTVIGEKTRLTQVFQNLIGNAIKYTDKPEGRVEIGCSDQGSCWKFYVSDNGPGISEKYHEKIFKMFQTLAPRDELESIGIGLAVVKKIVEMYGGKVWVESTVGQGCTFLFTLPKQVQPESDKTEGVLAGKE